MVTRAELTGRVGLVARGAIYSLVAVLALQLATGRRRGKVDRQGAMRTLAEQRFGFFTLALLAAGFAAYAAWRFLKASTGAPEGGRQKKGARSAVSRAADVGRGLLYASLCVSAIRTLLHSDRSQGNDAQARSWSARLLAHQGGRWLVVAVGIGLIVAGIVVCVRGARQKFDKHLRLSDMRGWQRRWLPLLGSFGHAARGVVAALVGAFLVQSALQFDPQKAVGVDGALRRLADRPWGPALLALVAVGLLAFGFFSFVEARWRKVLED